jgi:cell division protein FtsZ
MCALQTPFGLKPGQAPLRFELFGCGGAGCNLIAGSSLPSVAVGTDPADLERCTRSKKMPIAANELVGFADADPSVLTLDMLPIGIKDNLPESDVTVLIAGLGGFAGSNGVRLLASVSKLVSKLTIAVVSLPFSVESISRREVATKTLAGLKGRIDMAITFENDKLTSLVPKMPMDKAFKLMNAIMERPIVDLSKVMADPDVQMVKQLTQRSSCYKLGVGLGRGAMRDVAATKEALSSPWFDFEKEDVTSAFLIISSYPIDQPEVNGIVRDVQNALPNARLMFGDYEDPALGDKIRVTLLIGKPLLGGE